jgi:hypothetical protein
MVCFQTRHPNLGKFWRLLQWKMLVYFMDTCGPFYGLCYSLWTFGIVCGILVYVFPYWYLYQEKSGNPVQEDDES